LVESRVEAQFNIPAGPFIGINEELDTFHADYRTVGGFAATAALRRNAIGT
jgi:hypothetical protein